MDVRSHISAAGQMGRLPSSPPNASHSAVRRSDSGRTPVSQSHAATPAKESVLQQLQQRTQARKQRHRRPPGWVLTLSRLITAGRNFGCTTLPSLLRQHRDQLMTGGASFVLHALVLLVLAVWIVPQDLADEQWALKAGMAAAEEDVLLGVADELQPEQLVDQQINSTLKKMVAEIETGSASRTIDDPQDRPFQLANIPDLPSAEIPVLKHEFSGRSKAGRQAAIQAYGGTTESEASVNAGLRWLHSIQRSDGSWSFTDVGAAGSAGMLPSAEMGATSMALLCFLGAGHTHVADGPYRDLMTSGLKYLREHARREASGADLRGSAGGSSGMYIQGIAAICLCEASALAPEDKELHRLADGAVSFIERAQDPRGGGWRYQPRDPGDTSVVGWQLMALQSARAGGIRVSSRTRSKARDFLNSVQSEGGSQYGYMRAGSASPSMTSVGLLCRMYLGWQREREALRRGVEFLSAHGPSSSDMYYNYYATQVLRHYGGELWDEWNRVMREQLVRTQVREGPGAGSWDVTDPHGAAGGRIYQTTLSLLTLEVYYRHLPLYKPLNGAASPAGTSAEDDPDS